MNARKPEPLRLRLPLLTSIAFAGGYFFGHDGGESSPIHTDGGKSSQGKEQGADGDSSLGSVARKNGSGSSTFAQGADRPEERRTRGKSVRQLLFEARAEYSPIIRLSAFAEALSDLINIPRVAIICTGHHGLLTAPRFTDEWPGLPKTRLRGADGSSRCGSVVSRRDV